MRSSITPVRTSEPEAQRRPIGDRLMMLKTLFHLSLSPIRGDSHAARLESFYRGQAPSYDAFRRRLLHGRTELFTALSVPDGGVWYDIGAGTGDNVKLLDQRLDKLAKVYLVDLCPSLLAVARSELLTMRGSTSKRFRPMQRRSVRRMQRPTW